MSMPLTKDQIAQLEAFVGARWKSTKCPMCDQNTWDADGVTSIPLFNADRSPSGRALPLCALTCQFCGNTIFVNAIVAALPGEVNR